MAAPAAAPSPRCLLPPRMAPTAAPIPPVRAGLQSPDSTSPVGAFPPCPVAHPAAKAAAAMRAAGVRASRIGRMAGLPQDNIYSILICLIARCCSSAAAVFSCSAGALPGSTCSAASAFAIAQSYCLARKHFSPSCRNAATSEASLFSGRSGSFAAAVRRASTLGACFGGSGTTLDTTSSFGFCSAGGTSGGPGAAAFHLGALVWGVLPKGGIPRFLWFFVGRGVHGGARGPGRGRGGGRGGGAPRSWRGAFPPPTSGGPLHRLRQLVQPPRRKQGP